MATYRRKSARRKLSSLKVGNKFRFPGKRKTYRVTGKTMYGITYIGSKRREYVATGRKKNAVIVKMKKSTKRKVASSSWF